MNLKMRIENYTNLARIEKCLITINGMPHQLFAAGMQVRNIYQELRKYFYKEHSNVTLEEFWATKIWALDRYTVQGRQHSSRQW